GQLVLIQENKKGVKRDIFISLQDIESTFAQFPDLKEKTNLGSVWVADAQEINPLYLVDADGSVLAERRDLLIASNDGSQLIAGACNDQMSCYDPDLGYSARSFFPSLQNNSGQKTSNLKNYYPLADSPQISAIPLWQRKFAQFKKAEDYHSCLQKFLELGNSERDFTTESFLQKLKISEASQTSYLQQINSGRIKCSEMGLPISDPIKYQFANVAHVVWPTSQGAKFYSPGKYDFWVSKTEIMRKIPQAILNLSMGTFTSQIAQNMMVYSPLKNPQFSVSLAMSDQIKQAWASVNQSDFQLGFPTTKTELINNVYTQKFINGLSVYYNAGKQFISEHTYSLGLTYQLIDNQIFNVSDWALKKNQIDLNQIANNSFTEGRIMGDKIDNVVTVTVVAASIVALIAHVGPATVGAGIAFSAKALYKKAPAICAAVLKNGKKILGKCEVKVSSLNSLSTFIKNKGTYFTKVGFKAVVPSKIYQDTKLLNSLLESGERLDRNYFTQAGRAFQKHFNRTDDILSKTKFEGRTATDYNKIGQETLKNILNDKTSITKTYEHGGFDIFSKAGEGVGARFFSNGLFKTFVNPKELWK
ncbi:MAG TPA: hypothetical protein PLQ36_01350, partial [Candidatus Gracilibacteria bacterium]|nr:hypothetical protein [Candidatus Gracilibacteria bacterium]